MRKKFIVGILGVCLSVGLVGCGGRKNNSYPSVHIIKPGFFEDTMAIDLGYPFVYKKYETVHTDSGVDIVVHFVKEFEEE